MKIVSNPPKTGEEFTVSWVDSDGDAYCKICKFNKETDQFFGWNQTTQWSVILSEESFFKRVTILVSKGE